MTTRILTRPARCIAYPLAMTMLLFVGVSAVFAGGHNMTAAGDSATINGAIFEVFLPDDPSGSGAFDSFVRISANTPDVRGYNTDYRPLQFDENNSPSFTLSRLLSEIPIIDEGGVDYREFQLDMNQNLSGSGNTADYYLTLDTFELYESPYDELCGYPFDGSGGGHSGCNPENIEAEGNTATQLYDMDAGTNSFIVMDYRNNSGSGKRDLRVYVPDSLFSQDPNCAPGGVGCTTYVTLYSEFGLDFDAADPDPLLQIPHGNNDGFEEWGVNPVGPTAISLSALNISAPATLPALLALAAVLLVAATLLARRRSRESTT